MILAGEIGATRTRLAAYETEGNNLRCVVEKVYLSQEHGGLSGNHHDIRHHGRHPCTQRMFWSCRTRARRSKQDLQPSLGYRFRELAKQLRLPSVGLLNDLEAYAYGVDALDEKDFVTLKEGAEARRREPSGHLGAHRAWRGRPLLGRHPASSFCLRRWPCRFRGSERTGS